MEVVVFIIKKIIGHKTKRELQLQQSTLRQKQAQLERANRAQRALESAQQASSLVTATAQLWAATASIPIVGPVLAAVATAAMFAAFIASKVKAAQVAQTYGEGGLEFLEGGSHASGHDINLGVNNSKGKQMRAEGGEAMAIINKKNTKRYRSILPDVIDSLNRGTFEQKYASPNRELVGLSIGNVERGSDLSTLEEGVGTLSFYHKENYRTQNEITDYAAWAHTLKADGYATNPKYADQLISIIERFKIARLDTIYLVQYCGYNPKQAPAAETVAQVKEVKPTADVPNVPTTPKQDIQTAPLQSNSTPLKAPAAQNTIQVFIIKKIIGHKTFTTCHNV